ncbi:unnamed protein product [Gongylonema pulchrum]|uniref:Rhomboid domain-containing protein n=1 Tax=Gongylonema pulchrum TaxID=637853 RepID=A0A183EZ56_9BILA|nr:unnamed protein product [Gongylonema pulchrum]
MFVLISYVYLSWNGYHEEEMCELFYRGSARCSNFLTLSGVISHFTGSLLHLFVFVGSCALVYIIWRIMQMSSRHGAYNVNPKSIAAVKLEKQTEVSFLFRL